MAWAGAGPDSVAARRGTATSVAGMSETLWYPSWSPDGREMMCSSSDGAYRMKVADAPAGEADLQTLPLPVEDDRFFIPLSWSPSGDRAAGVWIQSEVGTSFPGIGILDLDTGEVETIVPDLDIEDAHSWPAMAWLPDGRRGLLRADVGIVLIDTVSGEVLPVEAEGLGSARGSDSRVRVSADGTRAIVMRSVIESDIWLATRD